MYEVIRRCESEIFDRIKEAATAIYSHLEIAISLLREIYTAGDSLLPYVSQNDVEMLLRKLPAEYHDSAQQKGDDNFQTALGFLNLEHYHMEVVAVLTDCLSFAASNREYSRPGTNEAVNIMIYALVDYITGGEKRIINQLSNTACLR